MQAVVEVAIHAAAVKSAQEDAATETMESEAFTGGKSCLTDTAIEGDCKPSLPKPSDARVAAENARLVAPIPPAALNNQLVRKKVDDRLFVHSSTSIALFQGKPRKEKLNFVSGFQQACSSPELMDFVKMWGLVNPTFKLNTSACAGNAVHDRFVAACMKLPDIATLAIVFHGTPVHNIPTILEHGLDPTGQSGQFSSTTVDYFFADPGRSTTYCRNGKEILVFAVVVPITEIPFSIIAVPTFEHQLPLGVVSFDSVSANDFYRLDAIRTKQLTLSIEVQWTDKLAAVAEIYHNILQLLIRDDIEAAAMLYSRNRDCFCSTDKLGISEWAHRILDSDFVEFYFPGLPSQKTDDDSTAHIYSFDALGRNLTKIREELALERRKVIGNVRAEHNIVELKVAARLTHSLREIAGNETDAAAPIPAKTPIAAMNHAAIEMDESTGKQSSSHLSNYKDTEEEEDDKLFIHSPHCFALYHGNVRSTKVHLLSGFQRACTSPAFTDYIQKRGLPNPTFKLNAYACAGNAVYDRFDAACMELPDFSRLVIAFHGTSKSNIPNILENGLDPSRRKGQSIGPGEYFSANPKEAATYSRDGESLIVFVVVVPITVPDVSASRSVVVVPTCEHQLPLGVVSFDPVSRFDDFWTKQHSLSVRVQAALTPAEIKADIISLLSKEGILVAREAYSKNKDCLCHFYKREISMHAHSLFDSDLVASYFPDLPYPMRAKERVIAHTSSVDAVARNDAKAMEELALERRIVVDCKRKLGVSKLTQEPKSTKVAKDFVRELVEI